jgi:protein-S-isoprenylcysteine O-methyltransferase Ste14
MISGLNLFGWCACVVYSTIPSFWLLIHPRVQYWRSRTRSPYLILLPVWIGMWLAAAGITVHWRAVKLYDNSWLWIPAAALFASGIWLYWQSSKNFTAQQLGGLPEVVAGGHQQRLVTTGIRAHMRHPVYLAHLCEMLAWSLGTGLAVCYGLTVFAVITGAIMIRMEDAELELRFEEEYRQYKARVPAAVPKLNRW